MRLIVALAALLTAAPSIPQTLPANTYLHNEAAIVRVYCARSDGASWGTAFKITATQYITARHVVLNATCFVDGQQVHMLAIDQRHDYATFDGPASPAMIRPSCDGFKRGKTYIVRGYPGGGTYDTFSPQISTSLVLDGFQVLSGETVIPGMSGGPVIDERGRVVGVIQMRWPNRSMPLSSTGLCK